MASASSALGEMLPSAHLLGVASPERLKYALALGGAACGRSGNSLADDVVGRLAGRLPAADFCPEGIRAIEALDATGK